MKVDEFDYELPTELIAQHPAARRDDARMLVLDRARDTLEDRCFRELPAILRPGDLLVVNNTRVIPARLLGRRKGIHAAPIPGARNPARHDFLQREVEVLLTRQLDHDTWEALVRPGRKLPTGEQLYFFAPATNEQRHDQREPELHAKVIGRGDFGLRRLRFSWTGDFFEILSRLGHVPLPPYIHRPSGAAEAEDAHRYQTIFAREPGSVAAPTAGLHFTPEVNTALEQRGIGRAEITLEVGLGTFQPVHVENVEEHRMHAERYWIEPAAADTIERARAERRRVIAVGTTVVRTLVSAALAHGGRIESGRGETDLFLYPGKPIAVISGMLTNFHLPRSTLLMLVSAFAGKERVLAAYRHAVQQRYRFFSYGDCMLIV